MTKEQMWDEYKVVNPSAEKYDFYAFGGGSPEMSDILAALVLEGKKTATASAFPFYEAENEPLPTVGSYNIILNTKNEAVCITKTTAVYTARFCDVTEDHAFKEGEGDRSLEFWRKCHSEVFAKDLEELNVKFTTEMNAVCEEFEVVFPLNHNRRHSR